MAKHLHAPELTDEVIEAAFCGTNFGRTDYRDFLAHSVLKKACDWHCGYTITCIMVELGLITPKTHKVTKLGKLFLTDSYPDPLRESRAAPKAPVDDLVMQIRRLVHALKKSNSDSPLISQVSDYMQRSGYWQATDFLRSVADE